VIADELGVTKNAAIGKALREGFRQKPPGKPKTVHKYARAAREKHEESKPHKLGGPHYQLTDPKYRKRVVGSIITFELARERVYTGNDWDIPEEQRRTLLTLGENECHWPVGDSRDPDFFFCGAEQVGNSKIPYCRHHAHIAYRAP
jgi:hypothetical protein